MSRSLAVMMKHITLTPRLSAIASFVADKARLLDVGTDHAYVPISLILSGRAERAWASDVNPGPLQSARENAAQYGVGDRLTLYLSDGLDKCECDSNGYDHIVIAGMGGELIATIIDREEYLVNARPKLILQPMTMQYHLRRYLCENGYAILDERIIFDEGKHYTVIVASYTGERREMTNAELAFGRKNLETGRGDSVTRAYLENQLDILSKIINGKKRGKADFAMEEAMLADLTSLLGRV